MVIKYKLLNNMTSEVEVDDELGKHITEMDETAAKIDRKETRRHVYMSELEEKGHYIPDDSDPLDDVIKEERIKELMAAIEKLQPQQKELLIRVYWNKELQKNIAEDMGISQQAISKRLRVRYYTELLKDSTDAVFVDMYADEEISETESDPAEDFQITLF